jgi:DNA ligase (NAD+)
VDAHRTIPLPTFLQALGVEHLGSQNALLLADVFGDLDAVLSATRDDLMAIKGIKEAIADALVSGLETRAELIAELRQHVTIQPHAQEKTASPESAPLSGKSFVFTGTLEALDRKTAQQRVRALGGDTPSGVSKSLTHLVIGAGRGPKSSKQKKAEKLVADGAPIEILGEEEFLALLQAQDESS